MSFYFKDLGESLRGHVVGLSIMFVKTIAQPLAQLQQQGFVLGADDQTAKLLNFAG
jgi:hypothetical protein